MTRLVKQLEKKLSLLSNENRLLEETNEELMRAYYEENTAMRRHAAKLIEIAATRFVEMMMCISNGIPKRCLRKISEMYYFSETLRRN